MLLGVSNYRFTTCVPKLRIDLSKDQHTASTCRASRIQFYTKDNGLSRLAKQSGCEVSIKEGARKAYGYPSRLHLIKQVDSAIGSPTSAFTRTQISCA